MRQQVHMTSRRSVTISSIEKASGKTAVAEPTAKAAAAKRPSQAAVMLDDLWPSVKALHDRVEKLRHRVA